MKTSEIRKKFLDYFVSKNHKRLDSSSLVPANDPTLLFTNAGMNQFKDVFEGKEKRDYTCATTCQKCVRAGGKHNDLDNVGYTARHHTFFEMLGNFSFSEYFKKEAIEYAWEFLTKIIEIPEEKLYVTIYKDDDEAFEIWNKDMNIPAEKIFRFGEKDNFWAMGPTGPCGPNSEIFYDFGEKYSCGSPDCNVGCECDRYVEVWNLVFMQFERDEEGNMKPLPRPGIDTGMGLERIAAVMQGVHSNYDIDIFSSLIGEIEKITEKKYPGDVNTREAVPFRVIADHVRSSVFLIGDGIMPSNEGRGYVLRRILRRAVRYGTILLNEPFIYKLVDKVVQLMGDPYKNIDDKKDFIVKIIKKEEELFFNTLKQGLKILDDMLEKHEESKKESFSGKDVFVLYDTYGFPYDLTEIILKEKNIVIDKEEFDQAMKDQKERSKANWKGNSLKLEQEEYFKIKEELGELEFVGYNKSSVDTEILYVNENMFIAKSTPFYGESGGQTGDTGMVYFSGGDSIEVIDAQKPVDGLITHICEKKVPFEKGEKVKLVIDTEKRNATSRHHSATHLLHLALREVLGNHAEQSGSYVDPERLRFDFKHFQAVTKEELLLVEKKVNRMICENMAVNTGVYSIEEAKDLGAMALFGEKYGQNVRVVAMGQSKEFCGGAHVKNTGDIGMFKILSESSIAASIRRIEAVCGEVAVSYIQDRFEIINVLENELKAKAEDLNSRVVKLKDENRELKKELKEAKLNSGTGSDIKEFKVGDLKLLVLVKEGIAGKMLREFSDNIIKGQENAVAVVISNDETKGGIVVKVTKDATKVVKAGLVMKDIMKVFDGKGGGKPDMAQGGFEWNSEKIKDIEEKIVSIVERFV